MYGETDEPDTKVIAISIKAIFILEINKKRISLNSSKIQLYLVFCKYSIEISLKKQELSPSP